MNIVLFGAPGAGKGTQSSLLVARNSMVQLSTGDLLRNAIKNQSQLGLLAKSYMDKGDLVPDSVVIGLVREILDQGIKNIIFDGFPRTVVQAEALQNLLESVKMSIDKAIFLEVPHNEIIRRLTGRRVCKSCGAVYHVEEQPVKVFGVCDKCGGEVIQRTDDSQSVIENRLKNYQSYTQPLRDFYRKVGCYFEVDGKVSTENVYLSIEKILN